MIAPTLPDRYRVLVVDDDAEVRAYVAACLSALPHVDVALAASGEEAVAAMQQAWFDLVLSDERMGAMDGVETLARARALAPDAVRVLMTAYAEIPLAEHAVNDAHVTRFLPKPFAPDDVVALVAPLLAQRRVAEHRRAAFKRAVPTA